MRISLELLVTYIKKIGYDTNIKIDINDNEPILIFYRGCYKIYSDVNVMIDFVDFYEILKLNNVIDELEKIKNTGNEKQIEELIYITLAKYISSMLYASLGKRLYPEIAYLEKHKVFFRE